MVATQSDGTAAFTDSEVVGNALTMLLAGEDTTSNTLAWMMYMMTEHPAVQARMQEEADRVLGSDIGRLITPAPASFATSRPWRTKRCGSNRSHPFFGLSPPKTS